MYYDGVIEEAVVLLGSICVMTGILKMSYAARKVLSKNIHYS